jgi:hypothetical protein
VKSLEPQTLPSSRDFFGLLVLERTDQIPKRRHL